MADSRYTRQAKLPQIGPEGQERLAAARVHVVGVGALGCPAADLLARAGVGKIRLIDRDIVERSNLHRQTLFADEHVGMSKAAAGARRLLEINPAVNIESLAADVSPVSIDRLFPSLDPSRDVLLDCTDNFETRYLLNDLAVSTGTPLIYAGVVGTAGIIMSIHPGTSACLRCHFPDIPAPGSQPTCETAGVLGPASAAIGSLQAAQAIRAITQKSGPGVLLSIDSWSLTTQTLQTATPDPDCPCCVRKQFAFLAGRSATETRVLCGRDAVHVDPANDLAIDLKDLHDRLGSEGTFVRSLDLIRGTTTDGITLTVFDDGRAIFEGITEPDRARALYARLVGS